MTAENMQQFQAAQGELSSALSRLMVVVVEKYPELKATQNFRDLQVALRELRTGSLLKEGSQRDCTHIQHFYKKIPAERTCRYVGFTARPYFESMEGAEKAPELF